MLRRLWNGGRKTKKTQRQQSAVQLRRGWSQFSLRLESLEERALLSGQGLDTATAGAATHLAIFTPPAAMEGAATPVEVVALDANNHRATGFVGTVSLSSTDTAALIGSAAATAGALEPVSYTFTSADNGQHQFFINYDATGTQSVTATDTDAGTTILPATASSNVAVPAVATHFGVIVQPQAQVGQQVNVLVVALDANNHLVPNYDGTVTLGSSDAAAAVNTPSGQLTLPQSYTFTSSDHGRHQFAVTFGTASAAGTPTTLTVNDSASSINGAGTTTVNAATTATHLGVFVSPNVIAGAPANVSIVALDANNHPVPSYTGTVNFSVSADATATLPASYTFAASDHGQKTFQLTFDLTGPETITVGGSDGVTSITGTASTNVVAAPVATHFAVVLPPSAPAGVPVQGLVVALGADGRPVPNYTGTVAFSGAGAKLPADYTFQASDHGAAHFTVTFTATGAQTVTVTDTTTAAITGSATTQVTAAQVVSSLSIGVPQTVPAEVPILVRVVALDANNDPILGFAGAVTLSSTDTATVITPATNTVPGPFAPNLFLVTFGTAGTETLTATDSADSLSATANVTVVQTSGWGRPGGSAPQGPSNPGQPTAGQVIAALQIGVPQNAPAGVPVLVRIIALDANNNPIPNFTGTVTLTSSDSATIITSASANVSAAAIAGPMAPNTFLVTFGAAGTDTLTATDSADSLTASVQVMVLPPPGVGPGPGK
jgi:hypothetical protein